MIEREKIDLESSVRRVLVLQVIFSLAMMMLVTGFVLLTQAGAERGSGGLAETVGRSIVSSLYGSALAIAGTILSARSVRRASSATRTAGNLAMVPIFSGLLNKLVIVGGGIALGLIFFRLAPIEMICSYIVVQFASVWAMLKPGAGSRGSHD